jgi:hypothetical protein
MPNRIISVKFNDQECLIHLYYTEEKMNIILLDHQLREALCTDSFSINNIGELLEGEAQISRNTEAVKALYSTILQQKKEAINSFTGRSFN